MSCMNLNHEEYVTGLETQDDSFYFLLSCVLRTLDKFGMVESSENLLNERNFTLASSTIITTRFIVCGTK